MKASFVTGLIVVLVGVSVAVAQVAGSASGSASGSGSASASGFASGSASGGTGGSGGVIAGGGTSNGVKGPVFVVYWDASADQGVSGDPVTEHEQYIKSVAFQGGILMEGPFTDEKSHVQSRMAIVSAGRAVAEKVATNSPLVKAGLVQWRIRPWNVTHSVVSVPAQTMRSGGR